FGPTGCGSCSRRDRTSRCRLPAGSRPILLVRCAPCGVSVVSLSRRKDSSRSLRGYVFATKQRSDAGAVRSSSLFYSISLAFSLRVEVVYKILFLQFNLYRYISAIFFLNGYNLLSCCNILYRQASRVKEGDSSSCPLLFLYAKILKLSMKLCEPADVHISASSNGDDFLAGN